VKDQLQHEDGIMRENEEQAPVDANTGGLSYATGLTLSMAIEMTRGGMAEARKLGLSMSIAIVDAGGHLINFIRMEDAMLASIQIATDKAFTAVAGKIPTYQWQELLRMGELPQLFVHERWTAFAGGFPVIKGGRLLGGIGVSGAERFGDTSVAKAALRAGGFSTEATDVYLKEVLGVEIA
jgi:cob(I)alamin adenosyltransferase